jgi:hypothetical protein
MAGYAAHARITTVAPRRTAARGIAPRDRDGRRPYDDRARGPRDVGDANGGIATGIDELVSRPIGGRLSTSMTRARELWSQTTFFLFDPNSWR